MLLLSGVAALPDARMLPPEFLAAAKSVPGQPERLCVSTAFAHAHPWMRNRSSTYRHA